MCSSPVLRHFAASLSNMSKQETHSQTKGWFNHRQDLFAKLLSPLATPKTGEIQVPIQRHADQPHTSSSVVILNTVAKTRNYPRDKEKMARFLTFIPFIPGPPALPALLEVQVWKSLKSCRYAGKFRENSES